MIEIVRVHLFARIDGTYEIETQHERASHGLARTGMDKGDALNYLLGYTHSAVDRQFVFTSQIEVAT
jgi:hypothetical protein